MQWTRTWVEMKLYIDFCMVCVPCMLETNLTPLG